MSFQESWAVLTGGDAGRYSCEGKTEAEWYAEGIQRPRLGIFLLTAGLFFMTLYVPILHAMRSPELIRNSSIRIMFFLGCLDAMSLMESTFYPGYQVIVGGSYCTHQKLCWIMGKYASVAWVASSTTVALLALARYAEVARINSLLFFFEKGWRVNLMVAIAFIYACVIIFPTDTLLFNANYVAYLFYPCNDKDPKLFKNPYHSMHNLVVVMAITVLHILIVYQIRKDSVYWSQNSKFQKNVTIQSCIISLLYAISGYTYIYFNWFVAPMWMVIASHIAYMFSSGFPSIIYLAMNKSIRKRIFNMFDGSKVYNINAQRTHSDTIHI